ncbi:MAG: D-Ala-D-Ala carboxypeptidase family metallohydrolase [Pseudomonadota bacterium]
MAELACRCRGRFCDGAYWHEPSFLDRLQALRDEVQRPLILTSGHRCPQWNAWVGGAPLSQHKKIAADISLKGNDRHTLRRAATQLGFTGLGLAKSFIHLDQRRVPAIWYYPGSFDLWQT